MIHKKDSRQESVKFDSAEDEVIIDLTDEVSLESEFENDILDLSDENDNDPPIVAKDDRNEKDNATDGSENLDSGPDEPTLDLNDGAAVDRNKMEDDNDELTGRFDLDDFDEKEDAKNATGAFDLDELEDDEPDEITMVTDLDALDDDDDDEVTMVTDLDALDDTDDEMTMVRNLDALDDNGRDELTMETDLDALDDEDDDEMTMVTDLDALDDNGRDELTMETDLDALDDDDDEEMTMVTDLDALDDNGSDELTMETDLDALDDDDDDEMTMVTDLDAFEKDDTIIVDNGPNTAEENYSAAAGSQTEGNRWSEDLFDLEESTESEYGLDDDENEIIELDEERSEEEQDFADLMLGTSTATGQDENEKEASEKYLDFDTEDRDDIIDLGSDQDQKTDINSAAGDGTQGIENRDGRPDLDTLSDLGFDEEDHDDQQAVDHEPDSSDDLIARAIEKSLRLDEEFRKAELAAEAEYGRKDEDGVLAQDNSREIDDETLSLSDEVPPRSEFADELVHFEEEADMEDVEEDIQLDGYSGVQADEGEEIIEITEFDRHYTADDELSLKKTGMIDPTETDEDDYLELIDAEEDSPFDDKELIEFNDSPSKAGEALKNTVLSDEIDAEPLSRKADRINQISPDDGTVEIEIALSPVDEVAAGEKKDDSVLEELKIGQAIDELSTIPKGEIHAAVEQILNEKFSGKIEQIIYEVIEKTVAKEIDRLKRSLLGDDAIDYFEP